MSTESSQKREFSFTLERANFLGSMRDLKKRFSYLMGIHFSKTENTLFYFLQSLQEKSFATVCVEVKHGQAIESIVGLWDYALSFELKLNQDNGVHFASERRPGYSQGLLDRDSKNEAQFLELGPFHPYSLGNFGIQLDLFGEEISSCKLEFGYEKKSLAKNIVGKPLAELPLFFRPFWRTSPCVLEVLLLKTLEEDLGIKTSERDSCLRMIILELARIRHHLHLINTMAMIHGVDQVGREVFIVYQEVESLLIKGRDFLVKRDCEEQVVSGWLINTLEISQQCEKTVQQVFNYFRNNIFWFQQMQKGIIESEDLLSSGLTGPITRAAGLKLDLRHSNPYYFYDQIEFEVPLGLYGGQYDRFLILYEEIFQSSRIIQQILDNTPAAIEKSDYLLKEDFSSKTLSSFIEAPHGQMGMAFSFDKENKISSFSILSPSVPSTHAFPKFVKGVVYDDIYSYLNFLNIVTEEVDL